MAGEEKQQKHHHNETDGSIPEDGVSSGSFSGTSTEGPKVENHEGNNHGDYFYNTYYPFWYPQFVPYYMHPVNHSYFDYSGYAVPEFMQPYYYEPQPQFDNPSITKVDGQKGKSRRKKKKGSSKPSKNEVTVGEENFCGNIGRAVEFVLGENSEATLFSIAGRSTNIFLVNDYVIYSS